MKEQHPYRATIPPVPEGEPRPLWSVMIPTYNCADYLRETLASVLTQDPGPEVMQIEVVDDQSTKDDPKAVVEELGGGRVEFYRQPVNVGHIKNFDTCIQRSRGHLIHLLHGDDCVRDGFYRKMQSAFDAHPELGAAFCRHIYMDEHSHWQAISLLEELESGVLSNWLERIAARNHIQPPSIVVRRDVYEKLGGFDRRICCASEDWEIATRIAAHYPMWYEVEPLAIYRILSRSLTKRCISTGENIRDYRRVIDIIKEYLPQESANQIAKQALEENALGILNNIVKTLLSTGEFNLAIRQLQGALQFSMSRKVLSVCFKLFMRQIYLTLKSKSLWKKTVI